LRAREIGRKAGLDFVYLGNVDVPGGEDTLCPDCGATAVSRRGFSAKMGGLVGGVCEACGSPLNIVVSHAAR
jgi:pyruvate formate lyase activating enzyme